jgi:hypothetical protein
METNNDSKSQKNLSRLLNIQDSLRNCGTSSYSSLVSKNTVFLLPVKNIPNILIQNGTGMTYPFSFKIRRLITSVF